MCCKVNVFAPLLYTEGVKWCRQDFQYKPIQHRLQRMGSKYAKALSWDKLVLSTKASNLVYCRLLHCITSYRFFCFSGHSINCFNEVGETQAGYVAPASCNWHALDTIVWKKRHPDSALVFILYIFFPPQTHSHSRQHTLSYALMIHCQGITFYFYFSSKTNLYTGSVTF